MGGKNKKHKAPGAAAVRAAVSAARAKSAEAAAAGEAASKKPAARPPPATAAGAKDPRGKQGTRSVGLPGPLLLLPGRSSAVRRILGCKRCPSAPAAGRGLLV